ncbi:hypothetical protein K3728_17685 [Rhodobacteraceae bacterium M385]|nr:hypothetical protein K3728_17685 [Rhodobacteraceae bacterium M385]
MNVLSILGYGAIGLGFLLAFLAYRLLSTERTNNQPLYVFMAFCLVLFFGGVWLQFLSLDPNPLLEQIMTQQTRYDDVEANILGWNSVPSEDRQRAVGTMNDIQTAISELINGQ